MQDAHTLVTHQRRELPCGLQRRLAAAPGYGLHVEPGAHSRFYERQLRLPWVRKANQVRSEARPVNRTEPVEHCSLDTAVGDRMDQVHHRYWCLGRYFGPLHRLSYFNHFADPPARTKPSDTRRSAFSSR